MEVLWSRGAIAVYELLVILALSVVLFLQIKRSKDARERRKISTQKNRNVQLEEMLKNPEMHANAGQKQNPYEVKYMQEMNFGTNAMPRFQVEIEVHTETSVQRYLLDLDQEVTIGSDMQNVLPINERLAASRSCSIFLKNQMVYAKNLSPSNPIFIRRGKQTHQLERESVKLQSKDIIKIGNTELHIAIYEN